MSTEGPDRSFVVCVVAGREFGLAVDRVQEVLPWLDPRPVDGAPSFLDGVVEARGVVVPVVDVRARLGGGASGPESDRRIVAIELDAEAVGVVVDEVREVVRVPAVAIEQAPESLGGGLAGSVTRIARLDDDRLLAIVDTDRLLTGEERRALTGAESAGS